MAGPCLKRGIVTGSNYEIVVRGRLTPTLLTAIDGFEVSRCENGVTHLVGWVPDQARLHSLLTVLRDLNIELKSIAEVESQVDSPVDNAPPHG